MASFGIGGIASKAEYEALDEEKLPEMFARAMQMFKEINETTEETGSSSVQYKIKKCMKLLEDCTRLVSMSGIFSSNESIEEISTESIQYMLLPILLGNLTLKLSGQSRKEVVNISEIYYRDFLQRCVDYGVTSLPIPEPKSKAEIDKQESEQKQVDQIKMLAAMASTREAKIRRYNEHKEMKQKLENLQQVIDSPNVDESTKRDYFITMIKSHVYQALDDLNGIENEKPMVEFMEARMKEGNVQEKKPKHVPAPLKPIIITKDAVQKAVFGLGYPSIPVMSVDEFYDQRVKDGSFPAPSSTYTIQDASSSDAQQDVKDREAEVKENKIEDDDPETLERARAMDEYKDTHRTGWGNRYNRS